MKTSYQSKLLALYLSIWTALTPMLATAEDIDIFTGTSAGANANPNILIVIDNTSNWSRQSQQWPGGITQGQSEASAIKTVVQALGAKGANVNIGLMEYATNGNANVDGGFIRYAIRTMTSANVSNFSTKLGTIYNNIGSPTEKRSANTPYGDLMYDVYNYYAGAGVSNDGSNLCASLNPPNNDTDANGYTTAYSQFNSPISAANSCARNFVIFIGNPNTNGPSSDSTANSCALAALYGGTASCASGKFSPQLGLPNFSVTGSNVYTTIGDTAQCYTSTQVSSLNSAINTCVAGGASNCYASQADTNYVTSTSTANSSVTGCSSYTQDCNIGAAVASPSNAPMACAVGTNSYHVIQTTSVSQANIITTSLGTAQTTSSPTAVCSTSPPSVTSPATSSSVATSSALNCPLENIVYSTLGNGTQVKTDTTHVCTYAISSTAVSPNTCSSTPTTATSKTISCYTTLTGAQSFSPADTGTFSSCPAGYTCSYSWNTPSYLCSATSTTSFGTTSSCYASSTAASTAIAGGTDIGGMTCSGICTYSLASTTPVSSCAGTTSTGTTSCLAAAPAANATTAAAATPALTCPVGSTCSYGVAVASSCNAVTTSATTGYYVSTPSITSPGTSSSLTTAATLTCPVGSTCNYAVTGIAATATGGGTTTSATAAYYETSAPTFAALSGGTSNPYTNNTGSAVAIPGTTLSCPAYNVCTYTVGGTSSAAAGGGTTSGVTSGYYASAPSFSSVVNSTSSAIALTGTNLSCPAHNDCSYTTGSEATTAAGGNTTTAANYKTQCLNYSPAAYTQANNTGSAVSISSWYDANNLATITLASSFSCPANNNCVISPTGTLSSCGSGAGNKYVMQQVATGEGTYNVTQTATPWNKYSVSQAAVAMSTYTVQQTELKNTYTVTQSAGNSKYGVTQTSAPVPTNQYTVTQSKTLNTYQYTVTQTDTPTVTVTTTPPPAVTTTDLGQSSQCFSSLPTYANPPGAGDDYASSCTGTGVTCAYSSTGAASSTSHCPAGTNQYIVQGNELFLHQGPNGTFTTDTAVYNADEWAKLLFQKGVPVTNGSNATVSTYTIDVYNKQPNNAETGLYMSMAKNGGGKYYSATNEAAIAAALDNILAEIQSVNSTFASASLPVNSTNRAQNANQVFIGMFRPDPNAGPRWFGNLKQYQIGTNGVSLDLYDGDSPPKPAINSQTGFMSDCAVSFWTTDSSTPYSAAYPWANNVYNTDAYYWNNIIQLATSPASKCPSNSAFSLSLYSDIPDGAFVEKGAVAEVLRKGNDPAAATPTWSFNRNMYTLNAGLMVAYTSGNSGLTTDAFHFTQGKDVDGDCSASTSPCEHSSLSNWTSSTNIMRPSVHGDVVHSRPLPINYGTSTNANAGVTAYYGSNDGTYRAVVATGSNAGKELWAFTAPEFSQMSPSRTPIRGTDPLTRLMNNSPLVNYPNVSTTMVPTPLPKDYFFDGSTGVYQNIDNTKVWIYPSMRRGGRMIYSFDVTNSNPSVSAAQPFEFKWRAGCPDLTVDNMATCTTGMSGIGQTWSTPAPVPIKGYSTTKPALVVGGGYDACEDADTTDVLTPTLCNGGKGHVVYVLDGDTGTLIKSFATLRSVIADISFVDVDNDGFVDYGYVLDTGGNVYRINFSDPANNNAPLSSASWTIQRIAYTSGGGRKFQWTPGLLPSNGKVYMAFASGDREHPLISNYPYTTPVTNRLYIYLDDMTSTGTITGGTNLDGTALSNFSAATTCTTAGIGSSGNTNTGWYMDFPGQGEQAVTSAVIAAGMVTVSTNRPIPPVSGTCSTALGEARGYWVNLFNASGAMNVTGSCGGDRSGTFVGGGLPPSPVIGTVPINGVPTTVLIGAIQREGGASSPIAPQKIRPNIPSTRKLHYWKNSGDN
jgi:Tfp pilus tip-associated adhesin PilY1